VVSERCRAPQTNMQGLRSVLSSYVEVRGRHPRRPVVLRAQGRAPQSRVWMPHRAKHSTARDAPRAILRITHALVTSCLVTVVHLRQGNATVPGGSGVTQTDRWWVRHKQAILGMVMDANMVSPRLDSYLREGLRYPPNPPEDHISAQM
jgi:hypothetical protein